jgi:pimeloyl-ACP methyl ester carboxylesterase
MIRLLVRDPDAFVAFIAFGARAIGPATSAFRRGDDEAALGAFGRGVLGAKAFAAVSAERRRQMQDNLAAHRAALLGAGLPVFTAERAKALRVPTQLIRGSDTPHFQRRVNQRLAALVPGARDVVVPGASHFVHEDDPEKVAAAVIAFVREISPGPGRDDS